MFLLDKKSHGLVSYLLQLEEPETVMGISKALNQSRRKIYYHLDKINEAMPEHIPQIIAYPRVGIILSAEQKVACKQLLSEIDDYSYVMNREERLLLTMSYIALAQERVTIEKIMQLTDVSRNTVLNDLSDIRRLLAQEPFQITLMVTRAQGYFFECPPLNKFRFFYNLAQSLFNADNQQLSQVIQCKQGSFIFAEDYFSDEVLRYFREFLQGIHSSLGKKINQRDRQFAIQALPYLLLNYRNMVLTEADRRLAMADFQPIFQRREYDVAQDFANQLRQRFSTELDDIEVGLIATLLLTFRKDKDTHLESRDYDDMRRTLESFLDFLTKEKSMRFNRRKELLRQLLTHSKALIYRKNYGIVTRNGLLPYLKEQYEELFEATKDAAQILEKAWDIQLTDDDVGYLAIHLGGELRAQEDRKTTPKTLIVCDDGVAIQKFLLNQCRDYLPNVSFEAVFTSEQFQSVRDLVDVDFVVSTVEQLETHLPIIRVHAVLSDADIVHLIRFKRYTTNETNHFHQDLTQLVGQHVKDSKEVERIALQIEKLLHQEILTDFRQR